MLREMLDEEEKTREILERVQKHELPFLLPLLFLLLSLLRAGLPGERKKFLVGFLGGGPQKEKNRLQESQNKDRCSVGF